MAARALPSIEAYPIPRDVAPGAGWSAQMRDMARLIGAYETLAISERFGGQDVYIPADADRNPFVALIGIAKARALSWTYRREQLAIPTARYAIARARRAGLIAAVRAGNVTVADAARIMGVTRHYASQLVNSTDEGMDVAPLSGRACRGDPRQLDMFGPGDAA